MDLLSRVPYLRWGEKTHPNPRFSFFNQILALRKEKTKESYNDDPKKRKSTVWQDCCESP